MPVTDVLKAEHRGIEAMLTVLERASDALEAGRSIPDDLIPKSVDFFRNFADRCHHHKEEDHLFRRLAERGIPVDGGPIGMMLIEHNEGRSHLKALEQAHASGDRAGTIQAARAYISVLSNHIKKEDNVLFPWGNDVLTDRDQEELTHAFDEVERLEMGEGVHEQYHHMIHEYLEIAPKL